MFIHSIQRDKSEYFTTQFTSNKYTIFIYSWEEPQIHLIIRKEGKTQEILIKPYEEA